MVWAEKRTNNERLVWVQRSGGQWWPALCFDHYGQALQQLASQLDNTTKSCLTLMYLSSPNVAVAHLLATNEFISLSQLKTRDFHENLHEIFSKNPRELDEPMGVVAELLRQDVADPATKQIVVTSPAVDIKAGDAWEVVCEKLISAGWKKKKSKSGNVYWMVPGGNRKGQNGKDYFSSLDGLQAYVKKEYGWNGNTNKNKRKSDDNRIWGRPNQSSAPSTPENQKTKPQDPGKPLLDSDDDDDEEEEDTWSNLWPKLKKDGWIAVRATRHNALHDWYYVRPDKTVSEGELGEDYFLDTAHVMAYLRNDEPPSKKARNGAFQPSPRKRSRAAEPPKKQAPKLKMKQWWFHTEPIPSFREVWNILHKKLDFRYTGGVYKLPTGSGEAVFPTDFEMRCHLVQHGIPNVDRANDQDRTVLERWVTFAHVPVKDTNSAIKLEGMQELSSEEASSLLESHLGFTKGMDGLYCRGYETFESLNKLRVFLRGAESLAAPQERRRKQSDIGLTDKQILELRLWAALARTPLPVANKKDDDHVIAESPNTRTPQKMIDSGMDGTSKLESVNNDPNARRITMSPSRIRTGTQPLLSLAL
jgi:hypothetical protein